MSKDPSEAILNAFADSTSRKILRCLMEKGKLNAEKIIEYTKLPTTTTYRKLNELVTTGVIADVECKLISNFNKKCNFYSVPFSLVRISITASRIKAKIREKQKTHFLNYSMTQDISKIKNLERKDALA